MSEQLSACKALAAMMVRDQGKPDVDEIMFVAHAALELGLDGEENEQVQKVLQEGGDFEAFLADVETDESRLFLFRRIVSATLIDSHINENEQQFIARAAESFGYDPRVVDEYISWLCEGIDWERRGVAVMARLKGR